MAINDTYSRALLIAGVLLALAACQPAEKTLEQPASDTETPPKAATPLVDAGVDYPGGALFRHMHLHAAQLERLNAALEAGDLEAAGTPAYWLSRHEMLADMPDSWRPHVVNLRLAARTVEDAPDLATAKAAAARIEESCRGCHEAAGR